MTTKNNIPNTPSANHCCVITASTEHIASKLMAIPATKQYILVAPFNSNLIKSIIKITGKPRILKIKLIILFLPIFHRSNVPQ